MVFHVVGRLGSGKTLWSVNRIIEELRYSGKHIYTNIRLIDFWDFHLSKQVSYGMFPFIKFLLSPFSSLSVFRRFLARSFMSRYHYFSDLSEAVESCFSLGEGKESSRLFIWDEIHLDLNSRDWKRSSGRMIQFFSMSRKLGFDIIMISQLRSAVDRQMRDIADFSYELKNLSHLKPFGIRIFPNVGIMVKRWANTGLDSGKTIMAGFGFVSYASYVKMFYNTSQLLTAKDLPAPLVWANQIDSVDQCSQCIYFSHYIEHSEFIRMFLPKDQLPYKKSLPNRLFLKR